MSESWLPSLLTETPETGFDLAVLLSRRAAQAVEPRHTTRLQARGAHDPESAQMIAASTVASVNFQTIAAANNWWR